MTTTLPQSHRDPDPIALCLLRLAKRGRELREADQTEQETNKDAADGLGQGIPSAAKAADHDDRPHTHSTPEPAAIQVAEGAGQ